MGLRGTRPLSHRAHHPEMGKMRKGGKTGGKLGGEAVGEHNGQK